MSHDAQVCSDAAALTTSPHNCPRRGGHLDPNNQLEHLYNRMIAQNQLVKDHLRKMFQSVRILVVGKAGCGKTTLIRLMVGDKGPGSISRGRVGVHNILTEWRHPDPALPLVIHDSTGVDTAGQIRIHDIRSFLDDRLAHNSDEEFAERVHAVWYVFSAMDNRVLDDGGLLETLDSYGKDLPLLFIMTHNDQVEKFGEPEVDDEMQQQLLEKIKDTERRKIVKESMVRVGNKIKMDRSTGEILKEGSIWDVKGMERVFERTKQMMHKNLWNTWAACQAVDVNAKLEASATLIVCIRKLQLFGGSTVAALPVAHQVQLAAMFGSVTRGLTRIWNVSQNLEKAIIAKLLAEERLHAVTKSLAKNTIGALALGAAVVATVFTGGIAAPSLMAAVAGSAWLQAGSTSTLLMLYGLLVLGSIVYVKTYHEKAVHDTYVEDYLKLCEEFVVSRWAKKVSEFSEGYTSLWETSFREKLQRERLRSEIVNFFKDNSVINNYDDAISKLTDIRFL